MINLNLIEDDGRDARRHGYAITSNPYNVSTVDASGRHHSPPLGFEEKREAWARGWRAENLQLAAQSVLFCLDSPLDGDVRPLMADAISGLRLALARAKVGA